MTRWLPLILLLTACTRTDDDSPIRVSVIGGQASLVDPNRETPDPTQRVLLGAVAETLVAYDEAGKITPALAERWVATSDGLSAIFRLRQATWPNGKEVTSEEVARRASAIIAPNSRNPLRDAFDSIEEINPTTPDVIEFRLTTPRPPLLELLAEPESAIISRAMLTSGPYRIVSRAGTSAILRQRAPTTELDPAKPDIHLSGDSAARAIVRFQQDLTDLVLGGTYRDWPILQAAQPQARAIRLDPAEGLFGLSVVKVDGFLADPLNRQVLAMVIDRDALLAMFNAPGWLAVLPVLPQRYRSAAEPTFPPWAVYDLPGRVTEAQRRVQAWQAAHPGPIEIRVFLPPGPGSTLLFGRLAADWLPFGIRAIRSDEREADVRMVDLVAPGGSALWYLDTLACPSTDACSEDAVAALDGARDAQSLTERGINLARADQIIATSGLYIPLARPLRWSLVSPRLTLFKENARAWHPLTALIKPRR